VTPDQTGHHCDKLRTEEVLAWISDGCALFDEELRCCFINAPASALFGQSPESLIAKNLRTEFPAFGVPPFLQLVDDVVASRSPRHVELRDIPTGRLFDVRLYPSSAGLLVLIADAATDRNSLLEQTARADFLQRLVDQMPAIVWVVDRNLRIQRFEGGKIVLAALGHDLIGLQMEDVRVMGVMKPNELEEQIELHRKALRGIASEYRANWDGMALEARVQPLRDPDGEIIGILGIAIDVTEQMQMQEKLRQSQKLEALGQLAGGVAHDFNNVLAAISGYAQLLHDDTPPGDPHREDLAEILKAAERAAAITRQLLAFSRRQALAAERLDLLVVVHDLSRMMRALLPASIDLQVSPSG
jgi:PAS domain S-box-containing protein